MKLTLVPALLLAAALAQAQTRHPAGGEAADARVELKSPDGQSAGTATITETPHGLLVRYTPFKLPAGAHAIHLHETGRCEAPSFDSAGGHFNPEKVSHGFEHPQGHHAGDMPNLHVSMDPGTYEFFVKGVRLHTGKMALVDRDGAALVVHAGVDDHSTDPAGDAGDRIACGVVENKK